MQAAASEQHLQLRLVRDLNKATLPIGTADFNQGLNMAFFHGPFAALRLLCAATCGPSDLRRLRPSLRP